MVEYSREKLSSASGIGECGLVGHGEAGQGIQQRLSEKTTAGSFHNTTHRDVVDPATG
jgi:hypothetical protein